MTAGCALQVGYSLPSPPCTNHSHDGSPTCNPRANGDCHQSRDREGAVAFRAIRVSGLEPLPHGRGSDGHHFGTAYTLSLSCHGVKLELMGKGITGSSS